MERSMKENVIQDKCMAFAIRIVNLCHILSAEKKEYVLAKQLLRAGTSIGANLAEAGCSISRKEFLAKVYISFKECAETKYWLELLQKAKIISSEEYTDLAKDCEEIYRIFSAITKTTRKNI